jgi:hypothetical protein
MFWPFKKKKIEPNPNFKSIIELKHKEGNSIKITVEGLSKEQIAYVSNRIKETFNMKVPDHNFNMNMDKIWQNIDKNWERQEEIFDSIFKEFEKKNRD